MSIFEGDLNAEGLRIAIAVSHFAEKDGQTKVIDKLLDNTILVLLKAGLKEESLDIFWAPGAFEIPFVAAEIARWREHHAIIALGCVIRGDTIHFDIIAHESARALSEVAREYSIPVINGILTVENIEQALERAERKKLNKGKQFAEAAVEMGRLMLRIKNS